MKKVISLCLLSFISLGLYAQNFDKLLKQGARHLKRGEVNRALDFYLEAEKLEPGNVDLNFQLGRAYLLSDFKHYAFPYISKVHKLAPDHDTDILFYLGLACQYNYLFEEGIEYFKAYGNLRRQNQALAKERIRSCEHADSLIQLPVAVEIDNLGPQINSPAHDYAPIVTPDQQVMVFTSRREGSTGGKKTSDNEYFEDIYICFQKGDSWTTPRQISKNINFEFHDAAAAISANGRELYLYKEEGGGDLYRSTFNGRDWSVPEPLGPPVNTDYWETSVSVSPDGTKLYFSSDRPGGFGGLDIYISEKQDDGRWGEPQNIGPEVNTYGNEDSPYIHPDGQTLFFSSDGHPGLGGYDVFKSELQAGNWQKPENMGYPINTPDDNFHFIMAGDRTHAYYTSIQEGGTGKADLYKITFLDEKVKALMEAARLQKEKEEALERKARAEKKALEAVAVYSGTLLDANSNSPLSGSITVTHLLSGEVIAEALAGADGKFTVNIPGSGEYSLIADAKGYLIVSRKLKVSRKEKKQQIEATLRMHPIQVGSTAIMANIFFDFGKASLRTESIGELDKIKTFLINSPTLKLQINGHTDNVGNATYNKVLSRKRAQAVVNYLVQNGIEAGRLSVMGYGQERPLVSNDDEEEGRELNRRTEIEVISF